MYHAAQSMLQEGTLSLEEFHRQLGDFVEITRKNGDAWRVHTIEQVGKKNGLHSAMKDVLLSIEFLKSIHRGKLR